MTLHPSPAAPDAKYELGRHYRLRKALNYADMKVQDMADHLGVSPTSVSNWINGHTWPRRRDLRDFALRTGYPIEWLETGEVSDGPTNPGSRVTAVYQIGHKPQKLGANVTTLRGRVALTSAEEGSEISEAA